MGALANRPVRVFIALILLAITVFAWYHSDNLVELIARNREVLFGRYSRPGFGARILITLLCGGFAALLLSQAESVRQMITWALSATVAVVAVAILLILGGYFLAGTPRYIEQPVKLPADKDVRWSGTVRHHPPNQHSEFDFIDAPPQARSYPNAPPGYGIVQIQSETDHFGFRNTDLKKHYPIVAAGNSFTAGTLVSDDQAWPSLLAQKLDTQVYNLGVPGADLRTSLNNFASVGMQFAPQTAIFMIDEGDDSEDAGRPSENARPSSILARLENVAAASPITAGLRRLSGNYFETIGSNRPIPDWFSEMGWMPLAIETPRGFNYYSFRPGQLLPFYRTASVVEKRPQWRATISVLDDIYHFTHKRHIRLIFVYVPSKPHITLAVAGHDSVPAGQLHRFLGYVDRQLPDADTLERQVFARLGNREKLFMEFCRKRGYECLSATAVLKAATTDGTQVYYTYDRHFTPDGNRIVANLIAGYLQHAASKGASKQN